MYNENQQNLLCTDIYTNIVYKLENIFKFQLQICTCFWVMDFILTLLVQVKKNSTKMVYIIYKKKEPNNLRPSKGKHY